MNWVSDLALALEAQALSVECIVMSGFRREELRRLAADTSSAVSNYPGGATTFLGVPIVLSGDRAGRDRVEIHSRHWDGEPAITAICR